MSRDDDLRQKILSGRSDANIRGPEPRPAHRRLRLPSRRGGRPRRHHGGARLVGSRPRTRPWHEARRRSGYRLPLGGETVNRVYPPLSELDVLALAAPHALTLTGDARRKAGQRAREVLAEMERIGLVYLRPGPDGLRVLPTNAARAQPELLILHRLRTGDRTNLSKIEFLE